MRWSKLKQLIEDRFSDDVKGRVRIDLTRYRWTRNEDGEIRVLLDGERVYSASYWAYAKEHWDEQERLQEESLSYSDARVRAERELAEKGVSSDHVLAQAVFQSLNLSIDDMIEHEYPLIRGLGLLDKRCGKRRLAQYDAKQEHEFVKKMHSARFGSSA